MTMGTNHANVVMAKNSVPEYQSGQLTVLDFVTFANKGTYNTRASGRFDRRTPMASDMTTKELTKAVLFDRPETVSHKARMTRAIEGTSDNAVSL